jgi:hypothetical protein
VAAFIIFVLIYGRDGDFDEVEAQQVEGKIYKWAARFGIIFIALWLFATLFSGAGTAMLVNRGSTGNFNNSFTC